MTWHSSHINYNVLLWCIILTKSLFSPLKITYLHRLNKFLVHENHVRMLDTVCISHRRGIRFVWFVIVVYTKALSFISFENLLFFSGKHNKWKFKLNIYSFIICDCDSLWLSRLSALWNTIWKRNFYACLVIGFELT